MKQLDDRGQTIHWLKSIFSPRRTLLVIDMQNDFISGSLPVPGAEDIIDMVEDLAKMDIWYQVWGHHHFQRNKAQQIFLLGVLQPGLAPG